VVEGRYHSTFLEAWMADGAKTRETA
jgi:hypothetical protein